MEIKELTNQLDEVTYEIEALQTEIRNKLAEVTSALETAQKKDAELRGQLKTAMADQGVKKISSELYDIVYIAPSTRQTLDSKKLKEEKPEIYEQYIKVSNVTDSVRITIKAEELKGEVH